MNRPRLLNPFAASQRTVRARLTLSYAAIFFLAGGALLGVTYGLLARSLPVTTAASTANSNVLNKLQDACKTGSLASRPSPAGTGSGSNAKVVPGTPPQACRDLVTLGARVAVNDQRQRTLHNLLTYSLVALGVAGVASTGLGWFMAGRALRPVRLITDAARRASDGHLGERLNLTGPADELTRLASTFDDMLERLDTAFARQKRFIADASHELRTPLAAMATAIDVSLAKRTATIDSLRTTLSRVRKHVDGSEQIIASLLTLAMSEREPELLEAVDLRVIVQEVLDACQQSAIDAGVQVTAALHPAAVRGSAPLLERLVVNLVDNAIRHNVHPGICSVTTVSSDHVTTLTVSNTGPVIPQGEIEQLFQPFARHDARLGDNGGYGLGLAIVKAVAETHHAQIDVTGNPTGGLTITVKLPSPNTQAANSNSA